MTTSSAASPHECDIVLDDTWRSLVSWALEHPPTNKDSLYDVSVSPGLWTALQSENVVNLEREMTSTRWKIAAYVYNPKTLYTVTLAPREDAQPPASTAVPHSSDYKYECGHKLDSTGISLVSWARAHPPTNNDPVKVSISPRLWTALQSTPVVAHFNSKMKSTRWRISHVTEAFNPNPVYSVVLFVLAPREDAQPPASTAAPQVVPSPATVQARMDALAQRKHADTLSKIYTMIETASNDDAVLARGFPMTLPCNSDIICLIQNPEVCLVINKELKTKGWEIVRTQNGHIMIAPSMTTTESSKTLPTPADFVDEILTHVPSGFTGPLLTLMVSSETCTHDFLGKSLPEFEAKGWTLDHWNRINNTVTIKR
jgi:hypothetical protein